MKQMFALPAALIACRTRANSGKLIALLACVLGVDGCSRQPVLTHEIEKPAMMMPRQPAPHYPRDVATVGDTAIVEIHVTVNPSGHADMKTVEVVSSPDAAFTRAVLDVLPEYRFIPAEIGGTIGGCRRNPQGIEFCTGGRPGKTVSVPVGMRFVFLRGSAAALVTQSPPRPEAPPPP